MIKDKYKEDSGFLSEMLRTFDLKFSSPSLLDESKKTKMFKLEVLSKHLILIA